LNESKRIATELKGICYICHKPLILLCGHPHIIVGGCCYGFWLGKRMNLCGLHAHLGCYMKKGNKRIKTMLDEADLKKLGVLK
jgi:hypothetical protein